MKRLALIFALLTNMAFAADSRVIDAMDALNYQLPKEKVKAELVDGKDGNAIKFSFDANASGAFAIGKAKGAADWDAAAGISFWVKGDGSDHLGGIEFIWSDDYSLRYACAFPIDGTEWKKISVPWRDLIPETCNAKALPLGRGENAPSKLGAIWFGKWWYWRDYAAHSYTIDDIRLEQVIEPEPEPAKPASPLQNVSAKLKAGKPIVVVTMGDSLTDFAHWANKPVNWPTLFKEKLHAKFGSDVTLINPAMGGTELRQNLVLIPRWLKQAPEPDLVTILFGGNDWSSGMRGEMFHQTLADAIDRIRRATHGKTDIVIMTCCPGVERWETYAELSDACRKVAAEKGVALADIEAAFHTEGKTDREHLFCRDKTHLGPVGHELVAKTVFDVLEKTP